jgi:hypothetical protein
MSVPEMAPYSPRTYSMPLLLTPLLTGSLGAFKDSGKARAWMERS